MGGEGEGDRIPKGPSLINQIEEIEGRMVVSSALEVDV
jgi:hypothetical protein